MVDPSWRQASYKEGKAALPRNAILRDCHPGCLNVNKKILVVDDDPAIRTLLCTVLRRQGLDVTSAVDGLDALDKARSIDGLALILLDVMMPNLDGPGFLAALKESGLPSLPIIVVITAGHELDNEKLDRKLVSGVVRKPFDIFEVAALVSEALSNVSDSLEPPPPAAEKVLLTDGMRLPISNPNPDPLPAADPPSRNTGEQNLVK